MFIFVKKNFLIKIFKIIINITMDIVMDIIINIYIRPKSLSIMKLVFIIILSLYIAFNFI